MSSQPSQTHFFCELCGIQGHFGYQCALNSQETNQMEQVNAFQQRQPNDPYSNTFNPGWRNHPYLSYKSNNVQNPQPQQQWAQPQQQWSQPHNRQPQQYVPRPPLHQQGASHPPPPGFNRPPQQQPYHGTQEPTMSDLMRMMTTMKQNTEDSIKELKNTTKHLENQIAQVAGTNIQRQPGHLPGQPVPKETGNAITTRSGVSYEGPQMPTDDANLEKENSEVAEKALDDVPTSKDGKAKASDAEKEKKKGSEPPSVEPNLPFPHRMQKTKVDQQFGKFLTMVKNLEVTVPFTDLVSQVPMYAKFLKEMITKKKDFGGVETVALTAECSAILQNKSPPKLKDPGSFSIPCHVGALFIDKALCDLGASVSVMPLFVCNR
ncbi:ataxin-2 homolog [Chenopodium quinoa]|uniref:ataxin-2 homolog n=1 Tax=Chenopodium quinoa TaxID=63459 RepID=UPI000B7988C6|nr:ataxin-2 homolog [Chenopodium quinoa]